MQRSLSHKKYFGVFRICLMLFSFFHLTASASDIVYICSDGDGYSDSESKTVAHYDSSGNLLSYSYYDWNGIRYVERNYGTVYTYDSHGNLLSSENSNNAYLYTYDSLNNLLEKVTININGGIWTNAYRYLYTYTSQTRISEVYETWQNNAWQGNTRTDYFYYLSNQLDSCQIVYSRPDGQGWLEYSKKIFFYHPNDYLDFTSFYRWNSVDSIWLASTSDSLIYDVNWNVLENISYTLSDTAKTPSERVVYTYDSNGNQTSYSEETWQNPGWVPFFWGVSSYNLNNQLLSSSSGCIGCGSSDVSYTYDSRGRRIHSSSYSVTHGGIENFSECDIYYQEIKGLSIICEGASTILSADSGYAAYNWSTGSGSRSISVNAAGTYSVSVLDSTGLWDSSAPFRVGIAYASVAPHSSDSSLVLCRNQFLVLKVPVNPVYSYQWIYNDTGLISTLYYIGIENTSLSLGSSSKTGCYRLMVSNACGVDTSNKTCIQMDPDSIASITVTGGVYDQYDRLNICKGDTITLTASTGAAYLWPHSADTSRSIRITRDGTYSVNVFSSSGCYSTAYISPYRPNINSPVYLIPADSFLYVYPQFPQNYYQTTWFFNGDTIPAFHADTLWNPVAGNYQITVDYPSICPTYISSKIVYFNRDSLLVTTRGNQEFCFGNNQVYTLGSNTQVFHGTPPYTYQWSPSIALFSVNGMYANVNIDQLSPGQTQTYVLTVTDSTGKTAQDSVSIKVKEKPAKPTYTRSTTDSICPNGQYVQVNLTAYGGQANSFGVIRLIGGCYTSVYNGIANLYCAGTYAFQYSLDGCASYPSDSLVVDTFATNGKPLISVTGSTNICYGDSVLLTSPGSTSTSSRWQEYYTGYIPYSDTNSFYVYYPGLWSYETTDANGCINRSNWQGVQVDTSFHITINQDIPSVKCSGDSVRLWFNASAYPNHSLQWMKNGLPIRNENDSVLYARETGNYSLLIYPPDTICAGASQSILIQMRQLPSVHITQNNNELEAVSPAWNYQWYDDGLVLLTDTNRFITINHNGFYKVVVTDYHGCSASAQYLLNCGATLVRNDVSCNGQCDGYILATPAGLPPFTYQWSNGDTSAQIQNLCQGNYSLLISDTLGCTDTLYTNIAEPAQLNINLQIDSASCYGDCSVIHGLVNGGTAPYFYQWCDGSTTSSISSCNDLQCKLHITDLNGCIDSSIIFDVIIPDSIHVQTLASGTTCIGCSNGSIIVNANGGVPPYVIFWSPGQGMLSTDTIKNLSSGYYDIQVNDRNQCEYNLTVFIEDDPLSVDEKEGFKDVDIYPNPVYGNLFIKCKVSNRMILINSFGQIVYQKDFLKGLFELDMSGYAAGVYTILIFSERNFHAEKLVVH